MLGYDVGGDKNGNKISKIKNLKKLLTIVQRPNIIKFIINLADKYELKNDDSLKRTQRRKWIWQILKRTQQN